MPLSMRRKGSISSLLSGKGHRRSSSDPSLGAVKPEVTPATYPQRQGPAPLAFTPLNDQDRTVTRSRPPPSSFRGVRPAPPSPNPKGKERAPAPPLHSRAGRAHWIIDSLETHRGAQIWSQQTRVILVVGEPSRAALAPLLYSPAFADTLVLVGSLEPIPELELLNSPSHLLNSDPIYPTVQAFQPPTSAVADAVHPVTAVLQYGTALAEAYRRDSSVTPTLQRPGSVGGTRSRRGSTCSVNGPSTPPSTPPTSRLRMWSFGSNTPAEGSPSGSRSVSRQGSALDLTRLASENKGSRPPSIIDGKERKTLHRRASSLFKKDQVVSDGSPIDAVINFIPFADPRLDPQRVLQAMLQNTVVLTTAALPILATTVTSSSLNSQLPFTELSPLSLIHIVPVDAPLQLPTVIERFLIPLLPTMAHRVRRPLFGCVTGYGAWLAPMTDVANGGAPGAETLLFGGVRCPSDDAEAEGVKPQAMLAGWDHCAAWPGALTEALENMKTPPTFSRQASHLALSELRNQPTRSNAPSSSQSMMSVASPSPPSSPSSPSLTSVSGLPPGAAPATRSTSPTAVRAPSSGQSETSPPPSALRQQARHSEAKSPSPPPAVREPAAARESVTLRAKPSLTRPVSDYRAKTPTPAEFVRPESVTPRGTAPTPPVDAPFISRFDPRFMDSRREADNDAASRAQAKEALRATLSPSSAPRATSTLPNGAAPPLEFSGLDRRTRGPSGLRNSVMPQQSVQPSPPTPELDPSSSSCSSSSVIEPSWSEERSSARSSKRSSTTPAVALPIAKPISGSVSRKSGLSSFTSIFKRRSLKA